MLSCPKKCRMESMMLEYDVANLSSSYRIAPIDFIKEQSRNEFLR